MTPPDIQPESPMIVFEEDRCDEEPDQHMIPDSNIGIQIGPNQDASVHENVPLGGTSILSTSGIDSSCPPFSFDFLGAHLLGNPLEALASVLPDGLFEDIGRTTPFIFAQDIIESQIAVLFL
jgi:hypothetical protein